MSEDLPIHKFRFPGQFTSAVSSVLGPLFGHPPPAATAIAAPQPSRARNVDGQRPENIEHQRISDGDQALMQEQLEAMLRQQLDGGGLRGRAPRHQQPQPEDIARVIEFTGRDRQSAIDALQNNGGDVEAAVNELLH
jgi:hypothetical protein